LIKLSFSILWVTVYGNDLKLSKMKKIGTGILLGLFVLFLTCIGTFIPYLLLSSLMRFLLWLIPFTLKILQAEGLIKKKQC